MKLLSVRPQHRDLRFALGDLEAVVLGLLWEADGSLSVRELQALIARTRPIAITTVATILDRLYRKRFLSRELVREGGPHYLYGARLTEEEFKHAVVENVMGGLLQSFNDVTVAYLAERMGVTESRDIRVVAKYLNKLRKKGWK